MVLNKLQLNSLQYVFQAIFCRVVVGDTYQELIAQ